MSKLTILFADDSATMRQIMEKTFAAEGRYLAISHRFDKTTAARLADNLLNNIREDYILMSEFQVIRFEGPDIIQPYFYSW